MTSRKVPGVPACRSKVAYATAKVLSQRQACALIGVRQSAWTRWCCRAWWSSRGAIPALRFSADPDPPVPLWFSGEVRAYASAVAAGQAAGSASGRESDREWLSAPQSAARAKPRFRLLFDWSAKGEHVKCLAVREDWTKEGLVKEVNERIVRLASPRCYSPGGCPETKKTQRPKRRAGPLRYAGPWRPSPLHIIVPQGQQPGGRLKLDGEQAN